MKREGPVAIVLTRQKLPVLSPHEFAIVQGVPKGGYILWQSDGSRPHVVILATGSEVHLALGAGEKLRHEGINVRVVSMPSWELFEEQRPDYRGGVLPAGVPKLALEAGSPLGWWKYVGDSGDVLGLERFGASAPGSVVYEKLGFSVNQVVSRATALLK